MSIANSGGVIGIIAKLKSGKRVQYLVDFESAEQMAQVETDFRQAERLADVAQKYDAFVDPLSNG